MASQTFSQEEISEMLQKAKGAVEADIIESVKNDIKWALDQAVNDAVKKTVEAFLKEEITPQIMESLRASKGVIVQEAIAAAHEMASSLAAKMAELLAKNLERDYTAKSIFKAMFD